MAHRDSRTALLDAGVELFLEGGYDFTGTNTILKRAGVPRGSFYHHFADKQDFALAVAEHYYESHLPVLDRILTNEKKPPLARLHEYFETLKKTYEDQKWSGGCLLGLLSQELSDRDPHPRTSLDTLFSRWRNRLAACLREAQARGQLDPKADCDDLAGFVLDGWEGALIAMKVRKSGAPLDRFIRLIFERVLES